jgi:hypothetical protein
MRLLQDVTRVSGCHQVCHGVLGCKKDELRADQQLFLGQAKEDAYKQRQTAAALRCANSQLEQEKQALLKRLEELSCLQATKSSENTGPSVCLRAFTASRALKATY